MPASLRIRCSRQLAMCVRLPTCEMGSTARSAAASSYRLALLIFMSRSASSTSDWRGRAGGVGWGLVVLGEVEGLPDHRSPAGFCPVCYHCHLKQLWHKSGALLQPHAPCYTPPQRLTCSTASANRSRASDCESRRMESSVRAVV